MNTVIATWIYEDQAGEETNFPQTGLVSSSEEHKAVYWRCVYMFFAFAKKYMGNRKDVDFCLFTNYGGKQKVVDGVDVLATLRTWNITVLIQDFTFKLPKGYYGAWGNQLYEFDILNAFLQHYQNQNLLMLDSDCIITKDISALFDMLERDDAVTFRGEYKGCKPDTIINGITEPQLLALSTEIDGGGIVQSLISAENFSVPDMSLYRKLCVNFRLSIRI